MYLTGATILRLIKTSLHSSPKITLEKYKKTVFNEIFERLTNQEEMSIFSWRKRVEPGNSHNILLIYENFYGVGLLEDHRYGTCLV